MLETCDSTLIKKIDNIYETFSTRVYVNKRYQDGVFSYCNLMLRCTAESNINFFLFEVKPVYSIEFLT